MTTKEMKAMSYEMQGITMDVKAHLVSLDRFPESLPNAQAVKEQVVVDLDLLISLAMSVRNELTK